MRKFQRPGLLLCIYYDITENLYIRNVFVHLSSTFQNSQINCFEGNYHATFSSLFLFEAGKSFFHCFYSGAMVDIKMAADCLCWELDLHSRLLPSLSRPGLGLPGLTYRYPSGLVAIQSRLNKHKTLLGLHLNSYNIWSKDLEIPLLSVKLTSETHLQSFSSCKILLSSASMILCEKNHVFSCRLL